MVWWVRSTQKVMYPLRGVQALVFVRTSRRETMYVISPA
jgi:hypothetical protein